MMRHPSVYAELLEKKIKEHGATCWLVNTGWTGGPYGVGSRMEIKYTRALLNAALEGKLEDVRMYEDPIFGFHVPSSIPGIPKEILNPKNTWKDGNAYDAQARKLAGLFSDNFEQYRENSPEKVAAAGPRV